MDHDILDNENFKKWFKQSKVKDLNGNPQIMYHGTYQSFDMFDKNKRQRTK